MVLSKYPIFADWLEEICKKLYETASGKVLQEMNNIYPVFNKIQTREDKEKFLSQRGLTVWFTGLSGSGKSTVASALEQMLATRGFLCKVLDGDNIRTGLNSNLGFSAEDRTENIRRISEVCKLFDDTGIITIASFVSPTEDLRKIARDIIGENDFFEVYMSTPLEECERRDVKGLYARARKGEVKNFTGISAPFDVPRNADISIDTTGITPGEAAQRIFERIADRISLELKVAE